MKTNTKTTKVKVKKESWQAKYAREEAEKRVKQAVELKNTRDYVDRNAAGYLADFDHKPDMYERPREEPRDWQKIEHLEEIVQYLHREIRRLEKALDDKADVEHPKARLFGE